MTGVWRPKFHKYGWQREKPLTAKVAKKCRKDREERRVRFCSTFAVILGELRVSFLFFAVKLS
jgi:hypothetical protein